MGVLVVGAGLSGATIARRYADAGVAVTVIDQRDHVGGNCYDYVDAETGIRLCRYGAHLFHTDDPEVWAFVNRFAVWKRYDHEVWGYTADDGYFPVPPNRTTINALCGTHLRTEAEAEAWLAEVRVPCADPADSQEMALSRVGRTLFRKIFRDYTVKQWDKEPRELDASVLARIPVRTDVDPRYFADRYQALPAAGYTALVENMLDHPLIAVRLGEAFDPRRERAAGTTVVFTGPIDAYFAGHDLPKLEYRSLRFEHERKMDVGGYAQPKAVVNRTGGEVPHTRTVEHKHFLHQEHTPHTIVTTETSCADGEPYYPVPTAANRALYARYKALADAEPGVHFVGRLASYKYYNMDQAIRAALDYFDARLAAAE